MRIICAAILFWVAIAAAVGIGRLTDTRPLASTLQPYADYLPGQPMRVQTDCTAEKIYANGDWQLLCRLSSRAYYLADADGVSALSVVGDNLLLGDGLALYGEPEYTHDGYGYYFYRWERVTMVAVGDHRWSGHWMLPVKTLYVRRD